MIPDSHYHGDRVHDTMSSNAANSLKRKRDGVVARNDDRDPDKDDAPGGYQKGSAWKTKRVRIADPSGLHSPGEILVCSVRGCKWSSSNDWALSRHEIYHKEKIFKLREIMRKRAMLPDTRPKGPYARPLPRQLVAPGATVGANIRDAVLVADDIREQDSLAGDDQTHSGRDAPASKHDGPGEANEESVVLDVQKASAGDLEEAAKELLMAIVPKAGTVQVDRLLQVVLHKNWAGSATAMRTAGTSSVSAIFADSARTMSEEIEASGFSRATVQSPRCGDSGSCLEMFRRNPLVVLQNQLKRASAQEKTCFFEPVDERNRCNEAVTGHPMSGKVAWEGYDAIKNEVMSSGDLSTMWVPGESFVCFLQLYSDVSCMSLKTSAFSFYPLHISVLNFVTSEREGAIRRGETVVAYLPTAKTWPTAEQTRVLHEGKFTSSGEPLTSYHHDIHVQRHQIDENRKESTATHPSSTLGGRGRCAPKQSHEILAESLTLSLQELRTVAKKGVTFEDADGKRRRAHLSIASYVADTPEVICVTCLIGGHCPRCKVEKEEMWVPGVVREARTSADTENAVSVYKSRTELAKQEPDRASQRSGLADAESALKAEGLTSRLPSTFNWPFTRAHPALDPYRIMRVDVMHTLPLGLQKEMLNLASKRLKSEHLHTTAFRTQTGKVKMFKTVRRTILSAANNHLRRIEEEAPSVGLHVDFARGKAVTATDGLFAENGIASMLEAKDLKNVAQVMPFLGAVMDRLCGAERNGFPVTYVFVRYVELEQAIMRRGTDEKGFTEDALNQLQEQVVAFKKAAYEAFQDYQASGFNFPKWHSLEHVVEDISDLGICSNYSADAFEFSHTVFKTYNRAGSQRKDTTLRETAERVAAAEVRHRRLHRDDHRGRVRDGRFNVVGERGENAVADLPQCDRVHDHHDSGPNASMVRYLTTGKKPEYVTRGLVHEAKMSDACTLASTRSKNLSMNFGEIAAAVENIANLRLDKLSDASDWSGMGSSYPGSRDVSSLPAAKQFIAYVGGYALAKKVLDIFESRYGGDGAAGLMRKTMHIVKSARVAGFRSPTLEDVVDGHSSSAEIFLEDTGHRFAQKIVSALSYSGRSKPLQDTVLIEGDEPLLENDNGLHGVAHPRRHMWVAKVLLFLSVSSGRGDTSDIFAEKPDPDELVDSDGKEVAVVRYYQVEPKRDADSVDAALGCVRLTWAMDADHDEPWVDVIPASSIRGRVHVVPAFHVEDHSSISSGSKKVASRESDSESEEEPSGEGEAVFSGSHDWKKRHFYVNRFRVDPRDIPYHVVDR